MLLDETTILRSGVTARRWNRERGQVSIGSDKGSVFVTFTIPSKGGGTTELRLEMPAGDFKKIITCMGNADRQAAMEAASEVLVSLVAGQPEIDRLNVKKGRDEVRAAAYKNWENTISGDQLPEQVFKEVARITTALKTGEPL